LCILKKSTLQSTWFWYYQKLSGINSAKVSLHDLKIFFIKVPVNTLKSKILELVVIKLSYSDPKCGLSFCAFNITGILTAQEKKNHILEIPSYCFKNHTCDCE